MVGNCFQSKQVCCTLVAMLRARVFGAAMLLAFAAATFGLSKEVVAGVIVCDTNGLGVDPTITPSTAVTYGDEVCIRFTISNLTTGSCQITGLRLEATMPDTSTGPTVITIVNNATIEEGDSFVCPGADVRCVTPSNCTLDADGVPGGLLVVGYSYIVNRDDEHGATGTNCPPTPNYDLRGSVHATVQNTAGTVHFPDGDVGVDFCKPVPLTVRRCGDNSVNRFFCNNDAGNQCANDTGCPTASGNNCTLPNETCDGSAAGILGCSASSSGALDACRAPDGTDECTCCGDGILQPDSAEHCDASAFESASSTRTGEGTCRDNCTYCGDGIVQTADGEYCDDGNNNDADNCHNDCTLPCSLTVEKTVALDNDCDGAADSSFSNSVIQDEAECVVYKICVTNSGLQALSGVTVNDIGVGGSGGTLDFDTVAIGATECQLIPGDAAVGQCEGGSCLCTSVEGINTAEVDTATCSDTSDDACLRTLSDCSDDAEVTCQPCSVEVAKTVALDDNCDGTADGEFLESVTQDVTECVVYKICVTNTGEQALSGVTVDDTGAGGTGGTLNFGSVAAGETECQIIPTDAAVGQCEGGSCLCSAVEGPNTATITNATCALDGDACAKAGSDCSDDALVACETCQVSVAKTVALDDNCDGTADSGFGESVTQDVTECVVYKICVTNSGEQALSGVTVEDTFDGGTGGTLDFGDVAAGATECQIIPTDAAVGQCEGGTCVCSAVDGPNTATITNATCALDGDACTKTGSDCSDDARVICESCQVSVAKTVALDDNCDGTADGSFGEFVTQDVTECVVYKICVTNSGTQSIGEVSVDDTGTGGTGGTLNFGTVLPGETECQIIPTEAAVGQCEGGTCVCSAVEGPNTATITNAICALDGDACLKAGSDCSDDALVECEFCRIQVAKTVALDDDCDGVADGDFADSVTQDVNECVVYKICVDNTGEQDINGVVVGDSGAGGYGASLDFGQIESGESSCQFIPTNALIGACEGGTCVCSAVEGPNTATITEATCELDGDACTKTGSDCTDDALVDCVTCQVSVAKTVALDDNCDGTADGDFADSVTQDLAECVVYKICVTNSGEQALSGVTVDDTGAGGTGGTLDFGDVAAGETECQIIPTDAAVGQCEGGSCVCSAVEGPNTATITNATCALDGDACTKAGSDCSDDARVICERCQVSVAKTVAKDNDCDGTADDDFADSVSQNVTKCVVYKICVTNSGSQSLGEVTVDDTGAGGSGGSLNFGTIAPGDTECQLIPTDAAVGQCEGGSCLCTAVEGLNTATITNATCALDGDACAKEGSDCDDTANVDCFAVCGDLIVNRAEETCDGEARRTGVVCSDACEGPNDPNPCTCCGDGIRQGDEQCDATQFEPGAPASHGACRSDCTFCGDGTLDAGEDCDGTVFEAGAPSSHGTCRTDCTYCGNGTTESGEACDDGNAVNTDTCRNNCTLPFCGDGLLDAGEDCDGTAFEAGAPSSHGVCRTDCTYCGNGSTESGEACDDGNAVNTDACRNNCTLPICGDGILDAGEDCDGTVFEAGAPSSHGICRTDCTYCGNGTTEGTEACDDGNAVNTDTCRNNCTLPICGDGIVDPGEFCDDGNNQNSDGCRTDCTACGDGVVNGGEECDGGDCANGACTAECTCPLGPAGCRITGGRTGPNGGPDDGPFADIIRGQGGGQVGAPCGCIGCFTSPDPNDNNAFEHIQGNWQYSRKDKKGTFHAKQFNSLICGCDATSPTCDGSGVIGAGFTNPANFATGELCNHDNPIPGPEPRPSPANIACFSGMGNWTDTNGRKTTKVAFRVEVEDRGEPSVGQNADDTCDVHRIRIWIPTAAEDAKLLADGACCTNAVPTGQAARAPNVDDGGNLTHGNMQIHPQTPNSQNGRCPVPDGSCQR